MAPDVARRYDDLDDFNLDGLDDDPFRSPSPQPEQSQDPSKKRKSDGLGIDEEIDVTKRVRVPRIKLDESRLLSENGIPKLRKRAGNLKFKGKGHEFSDAARLLSFYQFWLDDLFPKAKFLDALAMVEKAGHKRTLASKRAEWIDEGKPKSSVMADDGELEPEEGPDTTTQGRSDAPGETSQQRPQTPARLAATDADDVPPDEEDLYGATPVRARPTTVPIRSAPEDEDADDLDALMAEAEMQTQPHASGNSRAQQPPANDDDDDDLDALMAEADARTQTRPAGSGNQAPAPAITGPANDEFADDEAAMAEMGGLW